MPRIFGKCLALQSAHARDALASRVTAEPGVCVREVQAVSCEPRAVLTCVPCTTRLARVRRRTHFASRTSRLLFRSSHLRSLAHFDSLVHAEQPAKGSLHLLYTFYVRLVVGSPSSRSTCAAYFIFTQTLPGLAPFRRSPLVSVRVSAFCALKACTRSSSPSLKSAVCKQRSAGALAFRNDCRYQTR